MVFHASALGRAVKRSLAVAVVSSFIACQSSGTDDPQARVRRGEYLVSVLACDDCHSPKVFTDRGPAPDPALRLSGHHGGPEVPVVPGGTLGPNRWGAITTNDMTAWVGPWGTTFAVNLTPHPDGLGLWTEDQFVQALRTGRHLGVGRPVLPPMPWPAYAHMPDEDLRSIFAFLRTLPPVANVVPQPLPPVLAENAAPADAERTNPTPNGRP